MLVPLSWLKEYVDIKLPVKDLCSRLTEVGLGVEEIKKDGIDYILNIEITPNRPDCLSIIGIAREIAALENTKIKLPTISEIKTPSKSLPLKVINDFCLCPRYGGLIIKNVSQKETPNWMKERLLKAGLRPINILVDITNYVMTETGNPLHVFDYDNIKGHLLEYTLTKGGEKFTTVDEITYQLPKNSIVIKDEKEIIDLCGIKGGLNSGVNPATKNIFLHVPIYTPNYIRKTSQKLSLHSEASAIFERQADAGNIINVLKRATQLYLDLTAGVVASKIIDLKAQDFKPWIINLTIERINRVLGIALSKDEIISLLERIGLTTCRDTLRRVSTNLKNKKQIPSGVETCHGTSLQIKIPTYRNDLHIEEDLIEEIARIYGYNQFPQTMPTGVVPTEKVAYQKDFRPDFQIKNLLKCSGFSEVYTYSLISNTNLSTFACLPARQGSDPKVALKIKNPVNSDYEFLRSLLLPNLLSAIKQNQPHFENINLFELGKIYQGENIKKIEEKYELCVVTNEKEGFSKLKGVVEILNRELNLTLEIVPEEAKNNLYSPSYFTQIYLNGKPIGQIGQINSAIQNNYSVKNPIFSLILGYSQILPYLNQKRIFLPLPKYPAVIEDLTLIMNNSTTYAEIIKTIKSVSPLISNIQYLNIYKDSLSLRIYYQSKDKTLTEEEVKHFRSLILTSLDKLDIKLKS